MGLQTAFSTARSGLLTSATQTQIASRNIAGAGDPTYTRRVTLVETLYDGTSRVVGVRSATDTALQEADLSAAAHANMAQTTATALDRLHALVGDPQSRQSVAALIGALNGALVQAQAAPENALALGAVVTAANTVARALNAASVETQAIRQDADQSMSAGVARVNTLLDDFHRANIDVVRGVATGASPNDAIDRRNAILKELTGYIGVTTVAGKNGDMSIYADGGATLYQGGARRVSMAPTTAFAAGVSGNPLFIDGVPVTGPGASMAVRSGSLAGLANVRDTQTTKFGAQLDEVARALVDTFAETGAGVAPRTGMLTWADAPALPALGASGVAASIRIDPAVDPTAGGDPKLLRDGGIGGAAYVENTTGAAGFNDRLVALTQSLGGPQAFAAGAGLDTNETLAAYAAQSAGDLEEDRQNAAQAYADADAVANQATAALSNATGVNIDDQMAHVLQLERSFQAAAKMMAAVDQMYASFFEAVR